jgi:catechol 2,3-dioxygenase-like lactoylglutathione lyase family enzyme
MLEHKTMNEKQSKSSDTKNNLGIFSLSLNVIDIEKSYEFYKKLGFKSIDGAIELKWLVLKNGTAKIGLFQGMFPNNMITFSPNDARALHKELQSQEININFSSGLDSQKGPASFSITDPDGNPILIDQH